MGLVISHGSALELWRRPEVFDYVNPTSETVLEVPGDKTTLPVPDDAAVRVNASSTRLWSDTLSHLSMPLDLLASRDSRRTIKSQRVAYHVRTIPLPYGSLRRLDTRVLFSSPELCFLQMAETLSLVELIRLGFELCGSYGLPGNETVCGERGFFDRPALTSQPRLSSYLESSSAVRGIKLARRAMRHVIGGAASPMETALAMFLSLPNHLDGEGLAQPELNHRIDLPDRLRRPFDRSFHVCDLFWPATSGHRALDVEYQSKAWHSGPESLGADSRRANALRELGIDVITVTQPELYDFEQVDRIANIIADGIDARRRPRGPDLMRRQRALLDRLLHGPHA